MQCLHGDEASVVTRAMEASQGPLILGQGGSGREDKLGEGVMARDQMAETGDVEVE